MTAHVNFSPYLVMNLCIISCTQIAQCFCDENNVLHNNINWMVLNKVSITTYFFHLQCRISTELLPSEPGIVYIFGLWPMMEYSTWEKWYIFNYQILNKQIVLFTGFGRNDIVKFILIQISTNKRTNNVPKTKKQ